jgi:hypothetical protein
VAALATLFDLPYEDIYMAAVNRSPKFAQRKDGLTIVVMLAIAKAMRRPLRRVPWQRVELDEMTGVLGVNWSRSMWKHHGGRGHWVVLRRGGTIIDPVGSYDDATDYLAKNKGRVGTLLQLVEGA